MASAIIHNASYCKRNPKRRCYKTTDGKQLCGCVGGWSVFFATMRKRGWSETKPRPKKVSQTVFDEAVQEFLIIEWWESKQKTEKIEETTPVPQDEYIQWLISKIGE